MDATSNTVDEQSGRFPLAPVGGHGVRLRIGLAFSVLALVLFAGVGMLSASLARDEVERNAGTALVQVATRTAITLDAGMFERYREIQNMAAMPRLLGGRLEPAGWRAVVERLQASFRDYSWIGIADASGEVIAASGRVLEGSNVSKRLWFTHGLVEPFVGEVHPALMLAKVLPPTPTGEPLRLVDFSAPVWLGDKIVGVLGAHLAWSWVEARCVDALKSVERERRVEMVIIGADGQLLIGPASNPKGLDRPLRPLELLSVAGHSIETWSDGKAYLTATVRAAGYQAYPGLGWTVLVRQPVETAMAGAYELQHRIWAFGLVGAALFGLVGWWLAGRIAAPFQRVAQQAHQLAADAAPAGVHARRPDEVAELSASLSILVGQLRQRERELLSLNATLESRVEARTDALRQANADLQGFSRSVSHDLKGPIGTVGAVIRNVLVEPAAALDATSHKMLTLAVKECERLCVLVDELMSLAMVEQQEMKPAAVSMQALVDTVVRDLRLAPATEVAATAARAELVVSELPEIRGDAVLLRQVWHNLLANAFKFSARAAAPRIEVRAERTAEELVFSVRDNGAGFDMAQSDKLFGVFQRLHKASDFAGSGVGLSIVKRVIHRHGGRVWARAAPGEGAQFFFALPLEPVAVA